MFSSFVVLFVAGGRLLCCVACVGVSLWFLVVGAACYSGCFMFTL